jgi:hypothetical protein
MIKWTSLMLGFGLFFGATTAVAQSESRDRFRVGARLGFALPFGTLNDIGLRHFVPYQVPVALDAGHMIGSHVLIGAYGQYGVAAAGDYAGPNVSRSDISFGAQAQFHPCANGLLDPWLGVGAGYEILRGSSRVLRVQVGGFELVKLQGGVDFRLARAFALGPFLSYSVGEYKTLTDEFGDSGRSTTLHFDIAGRHEWLTAGVKGTFAL